MRIILLSLVLGCSSPHRIPLPPTPPPGAPEPPPTAPVSQWWCYAQTGAHPEPSSCGADKDSCDFMHQVDTKLGTHDLTECDVAAQAWCTRPLADTSATEHCFLTEGDCKRTHDPKLGPCASYAHPGMPSAVAAVPPVKPAPPASAPIVPKVCTDLQTVRQFVLANCKNMTPAEHAELQQHYNELEVALSPATITRDPGALKGVASACGVLTSTLEQLSRGWCK